MNAEAKKLWERIGKKREELGAADFAVMQAEGARAQLRQELAGLAVRFSDLVGEIGKEQGIDPSRTPFNVERFEFETEAAGEAPS